MRYTATKFKVCLEARVQFYSLSITYDRSNSTIFCLSSFHNLSSLSTNYLSKTG